MEENPMKFDTLLLDLDNTLFDFNAGEEIALQSTFEKFGYPFDENIKARYEVINQGLWKRFELGEIDTKTVIYSRFGILFQEMGIKDDGIAFEDIYQELLGQQAILLEGAIEFLDYVQGKYNLYIVTNGVGKTQHARLQLAGIHTYMKDIFVSGEIGHQKPKKEFFDYCFTHMKNVDLERTLIIGDSLTSDILGGYNAGIKTCWLNPKKVENHLQIAVDYEIASLRELNMIL